MRKEIRKTIGILDKQMIEFTAYFAKSLTNNPTIPADKLYREAVSKFGIIDITANTIQGGVINNCAIGYGIIPKLSADIVGIDSTKKLKAIYGADYGKELSSAIYESVTNAQKETYALIQKNAKSYKTWKNTSTELRKTLKGNLKGYENIPKHLDNLSRAANDALISGDSAALKKQLKNSRKQVEKLTDRRSLKKSYSSAINGIEKAIKKGDKLLLEKSFNSYITAKNQSLVERITLTEQTRAYNQGIYDDYADQSDIVKGFKIVLSPQHPRYDICDVLKADNPYSVDFVPDMPPHPNSWTTIEPYTGQKKTNKYNPNKAAKEAKNNGLSNSSQQALKEKGNLKRVDGNKEAIKTIVT